MLTSNYKSLTANYKSLTANYKSLTANSNRPQQIQINGWFVICCERFVICCERFEFAVGNLHLLWAIWICCERFVICCDHLVLIWQLWATVDFCDYSMLITLYKIGELHFHLLGTNGFHVKAKSERFTAASSCCVITSNMTISRRRLADYCDVKTLHQKACRTIIFLHPTNEIIDLLRCRWRCRRQILKSLLGSLGSYYGCC